jgi:hypothetical protein
MRASFGYPAQVPVITANVSSKKINWKMKCTYRGNPFQNAVAQDQPPIVIDTPKVQTTGLAQSKPVEARTVVVPPAESIPKTFACSICTGTLPLDDLFIATTCKHELCRGCATTYIKSEFGQMNIPIRCWMHWNGCKEDLCQSDLGNVLHPESMNLKLARKKQ